MLTLTIDTKRIASENRLAPNDIRLAKHGIRIGKWEVSADKYGCQYPNLQNEQKWLPAMISQTAEYALRAIVFLANQQGLPQTTTQIAEATQVPPGYLAKVMQGLARSTIVRSQRGLNGGFTLVQSPEDFTVLSVVNAVDPIRRYPECPLGIADHGRRLCPLHKRLDQAGEMVENAFGQTSIAELITPPKRQGALCSFPRAAKATR